MERSKTKWLFEMTLPNLRADVVQVEQLLAEGAKPGSDLLGTLRVNLGVCERNASAELSEHDHEQMADLRDRAWRLLRANA